MVVPQPQTINPSKSMTTRSSCDQSILDSLNKLNQFNGNFEQAEMVKAFLVSGEYRNRFQ